MRLLGIRRGAKYSPNLVDSDAAIFNKVAQNLREMGHEVDVIDETGMRDADYDHYDRIFGMERDMETVAWVNDGVSEENRTKFLNTISGIMTCTMKGRVCMMMKEMDIPQPHYAYTEGGKACVSVYGQTEYPVWVKNGVSSAVTTSDTVYCQDDNDVRASEMDLMQRGADAWLVQEHMRGDLIKFYGVEGTDFFHWQYASSGHSKFGLESINGKEKGYCFDPLSIKKAIDRLAEKIGVPIYGGDAIIDADGHFYVIDFNDFPSFSSCREEAARAIAARIVK